MIIAGWVLQCSAAVPVFDTRGRQWTDGGCAVMLELQVGDAWCSCSSSLMDSVQQSVDVSDGSRVCLVTLLKFGRH